MKSASRISKEIQRLEAQKPLAEKSYYAVTLLGTDEGKINRYWQSHMIGWAGDDRKRQIREISFVDPTRMMQILKDIDEPGVLVNNAKDFFLYYLIGGHGVVEHSVCERFLPDIIEPREIVRSISRGLICTETAPESWFRRAPTKKDRVRLLKRDRFRCRVCGRSPHDYVDVELHLHHVLPWGKGGLTEDDNLVTICQTCHDGLDPHYDPELFSMIGINTILPDPGTSEEYRRGVTNYRKLSVPAYKELYNRLQKQKVNKNKRKENIQRKP